MKSSRAIRIITSLSVGVVLIASLSWLGLGQVSGQISRIDVFGSLKDRPEKTSSLVLIPVKDLLKPRLRRYA